MNFPSPAQSRSATDWAAVLLISGAGVAVAFQIGKAPAALPMLRADLRLDLRERSLRGLGRILRRAGQQSGDMLTVAREDFLGLHLARNDLGRTLLENGQAGGDIIDVTHAMRVHPKLLQHLVMREEFAIAITN